MSRVIARLIIYFLVLLVFSAVAQTYGIHVVAATRTITFSGFDWGVKSCGPCGPGSNYWWDGTETVWVDGQGWLHLKIKYMSGRWYSSEVYLTRSLGWGRYQFWVNSRVDLFDKFVVGGLFVYQNDQKELDIEFSQWNGETTTNGQYAVQWDQSPNVVTPYKSRFNIALTGDYTSHFVDWQQTSVTFTSVHGHYDSPPGGGYITTPWTDSHTTYFPQPQNERAHISLWLYGATPTDTTKEYELIIQKFQFTSYDTTPPSNPTSLWSPSHSLQTWSTDNTVDVQWSGATDDSSGVYGYSRAWDTSPSTIPPTTVDQTVTYCTSPPLSTGSSWYFHVRTVDYAGNWASNANTLGPFYIDTVPPNTPALSESHSGTDWTTHNSPYFTWNDPGDLGSGVGSYEGSVDGGAPFPVSNGYHPTWSDGIHRFKIRAADLAGNRGSWSSEITVKIDTTASVGSISINNGATYTTSPSVTLSVSAVDGSGSGVVDMCFSNDGSSWSSWEYYATTKSWTLASGDGTKTAYVKYKDYVGLVSSAASDTIVLDTSPPSSVALSSPTSGTTTSNTKPAFAWNQASDATSGVGSYTFQIDTSTAFNSQNLRTIAGISSTSYTPGTDLTVGTWYWHVKAIDNAGNEGSFSSYWSVSIQILFQFSISTPSSQSTSQGGSATFSFTVTATSGTPQSVTLSLLNQPSGTTLSWNPSNTVTPGTGGSNVQLTVQTSCSTPAQPYSNLQISGSGGVTSAQSGYFTLTVSSYSSCQNTLSVGLVSPPSPSNGATVTSSPVTLKAQVTSGGGAVQGASVIIYVDGVQACSGTSDSSGYYSCSYSPTQSGHTYSWYATASEVGYTSGTSPTWTFTYPPGGHTVRFTAVYKAGDLFSRNVYYTVDGGSQQLLGTFSTSFDKTFTVSYSSSILVFVNVNPGTVYYEELYVDGSKVKYGYVGNNGLAYPSSAPYQVTFNVNPSSGGLIRFSWGDYTNGQSELMDLVAVSVTAVLNGPLFSGWGSSGGVSLGSSTANPTTVTVSGSGSITANFAPLTVTVYSADQQYVGQDPTTLTDVHASIQNNYQNQAAVTTYSFSVPANTQVTFSVSSSPSGWVFAHHWEDYGYGQSEGASLTINVGTDNRKVVAFFSKIEANELAYDDGRANFGFESGPHAVACVKFTVPSPVKIVKLKFNVLGGSMNPVNLYVWDSSHANPVFSAMSVTPSQGWFEYVVPSEVVVSGDFYVGWEWPNGGDPWFSVDSDPPYAGRTYLFTLGNPNGSPHMNENYMIRVVYGPAPPATMTLSYSIVGGGTGYSVPMFNYVESGVSKQYTLTTSAASISVDAGSSWSVTPNPLSGSSSSERWYSSQTLSGTASTQIIVFTFYHQYSLRLSYSVSGGGSGYSAPTFTASRSGVSAPQTLTSTATGYWCDADSSWSATNPLSGSGASERWITPQTTSGTVSSTETIAFAYQRQYYLTTQVNPSGGGSVSVSSGWQNAGITVPIAATPNTDYIFNYWSLDGANLGSNPSYSVLMNAAHTLTAFFLGSSSMSLGTSSGSIGLGGSVTFSGTITPAQPTGTAVALSYSLDGSTWIPFAGTMTDGSGGYSLAWYPPYPNSYQVRANWKGNANYAGATSSAAALSVTGTMPPQVMLLVTGPPSVARGGAATFDLLVTNPGSSLTTTLYIEVTGPGGYEYFDILQVSVADASTGRYQFLWQTPLTSGTYQVLVGFVPPKTTSISQTQITVI